ncbi:MAG: sporulation initiation factor Spo0A C-terminal domain-containing protein [Clostridia bacterium]|nr:sporulation initiation factor Spo0A C-terminal domain-containing protein [Clostridia bacterium]
MSAYNDIPTEFTEYSGEELTRQVKLLISELGVPRRLKGFSYLCRAIELVYMEPSAIQNVIVGLYRQIAVENNTTVSCIERNCRTAIKLLWQRCDTLKLAAYFSCNEHSNAPSVREFVALLADKLRRNLINVSTNSILGGDKT